MEFLLNYGLFITKLISLVIAILIIAAGLVAIFTKNKTTNPGGLTLTKLNERFKSYQHEITAELGSKKDLKKLKKSEKAAEKKSRSRIFILNFIGDMRASAVSALREEISALLLVAKPEDSVLVRLESPGGLVNAYGLASSQLERIRAAKIKLIISVDKVAASGGYMMACVADHIIAAPFAIIGSIGVVAQLPNFHRFLEKKNIDWEMFTAGDYKRTVTMLGQNTEKGREKFQEELEETHELFKQFIQQFRPKVNIEKVATGEHWYAQQALEFQLVDALQTSDDFLLKAREEYELIELSYQMKKTLLQRLGVSAEKTWLRLSGQELS